MAIQDALAFLAQARREERLAREVEALGDDAPLESLAAVGERAGYLFTVEELRRAHALDWNLRRARYLPRTQTTDSEPD
jgi:hypothetical protein